MPLHPSARRVLRFLVADTELSLEASAADRRRSLLDFSLSLEADPTPVKIVYDLTIPSGHGGIRARIYNASPRGATAIGGLVYFHGGGWVAGGLDTHDGFCRRLAAAAGCQLLAIDYRLAPEHRFPAALDDCVTAFRWAAESGAQGGQIHSRLAIGGNSTGAGLAAAASALLRDAGGPRPVGQLLVCPVLAPRRLTGSRRSLARGHFVETAVIERDLSDYCPDDIDRSDVRVSPLLAQTFAGLPRTIVHTAEFDPFRDEGRDYVKALLRSGVPAQEVQHDGMIHYFYALPRAIPYATLAAKMMGENLGALLRDPET